MEGNALRTKLCTKCQRVKSISQFPVRKDRPSGYYYMCKTCDSTTSREWIQKNPQRRIWQNAKRRAKQKGLEFDIYPADIRIPEVCPLLGIPITELMNGDTDSSPSLDRINPRRGYTRDNIWVISARANRIKNDSQPGELLKIAASIASKKLQNVRFNNASLNTPRTGQV